MENKIQAASLVDLKAELYRKQEEFKQQKLKEKGSSYIRPKTSEKKNDIWSKKNTGVLERAKRDLEKKVEEENAFENSRKKLEEKARMYDRITEGSDIPEEDGSKLYLVDFEKKVIDQMIDVREKDREARKREEENERRKQEEEILSKADIPPPANKEEEWVDYTDAFGRTRTCMRKDLKDLREKDRKTSDKRLNEMPTLLSEDMRREIQRQKWEDEAKANLNGPVHYSNVQFDEIRNHGTGFFQFSKTEEDRQKEMETLGDIRQQTLDERSRRERLKEKRKAMLDARLAKVKKRKQQIAGIISTETEEDIQLKEPVSDHKEKTATEEPKLLTRDVNINKNKPEREWDKGKDRLFPHPSATTEERYFEEKRGERQPEFAPPSFYYSDTKKNPAVATQRLKTGSNYSVFDQKETHTKKKWPISSHDNNVTCELMPPLVYPDENVVEKSNILCQPDTSLDNTAIPPSNSQKTKPSQLSSKTFGPCTDTENIEEFLKRERQETSKTRQSDDRVPGVEPCGSVAVEDIPLPGQRISIGNTDTNVTFPSKVQSNSLDFSYNQENMSSGSTVYDFSTETKNKSGWFQHNPMSQFDVYGQPNLNLPPPGMVNPFSGTFSVPAGTEGQHSYTVSSADVHTPGYVNINTQQSKPEETAPVYITPNTEETNPVYIPKSSIVDTRLIRNESYKDYSADETKDGETGPADTNLQSDCDIPNQPSNRSVFSSAPVKYPQSQTFETTDQ
ncbi:coiled-coil domain-containing protein 174-like [Ylistrum balloti]|uniref:coiled-coil domain-containing protein 174-like n=1 Tax=Ylistrum balloti TaxID=509963 RepID=UPI002905A7BC|nr:coiled-coil domain-containing protein 174-like [Ylistrum balloti]